MNIWTGRNGGKKKLARFAKNALPEISGILAERMDRGTQFRESVTKRGVVISRKRARIPGNSETMSSELVKSVEYQ